MYFSLRTTIFWNIFILMVAAIVLISFVVFRVTEREIVTQHTLSRQVLFSSIEAGLSSWLLHHPDGMDRPSAAPELKGFVNRFVRDGICRSIVLVNTSNSVVTHAGIAIAGRPFIDKDIQRAMISKAVCTNQYKDPETAGRYLAVAGPVYLQGREAGYLKAVFPLQAVLESVARSSHMILLYILLDAVILMGLGFFLLSRYLAAPIRKLTRLTETLSDGNLNGLPLFLSEKNEIGKLSTALTTMAEKLLQE
ncbi:MAG: HAMP domain-containing protein, partial [Pseudomonadota bacterium]